MTMLARLLLLRAYRAEQRSAVIDERQLCRFRCRDCGTFIKKLTRDRVVPIIYGKCFLAETGAIGKQPSFP